MDIRNFSASGWSAGTRAAGAGQYTYVVGYRKSSNLIVHFKDDMMKWENQAFSPID